MKILFPVLLLLLVTTRSVAQIQRGEYQFQKEGKGIQYIQKDSLYSIKLQFRIQNRLSYLSTSGRDFTPKEFDFTVRRMRLKMRGFVLNPKFTYYAQLAFSKGDMSWESNEISDINTSPNVLRDAMFYYQANPNLQIGIGQTKLPGNRERVISSGNLQFADRSLVNQTFNLDRDFGVFLNYKKEHYILQAAITSGEGRNTRKSDYGLSYTARAEYLPFGPFTNGNDYSEGDLVHEQKPKFSMGLSYNFNHHAQRVGGQTGLDLYSPINMHTSILDWIFKYRGFSYLQELVYRDSKQPITQSIDNPALFRSAYTGFGSLTQISYHFLSNYEISARYAIVSPLKKIYNNSFIPQLSEKQFQQVHLGLTRYLYGHHLKIQGNLIYEFSQNLKTSVDKNQFGAMLQIEIGF